MTLQLRFNVVLIQINLLRFYLILQLCSLLMLLFQSVTKPVDSLIEQVFFTFQFANAKTLLLQIILLRFDRPLVSVNGLL